MRIALIGPRGTGKTTISKILSEKSGFPSFSTDALIEQKANTTIPQIVREKGWEGFREIEQKVVAELSTIEDAIIDCGGGVVERPINLEYLKSSDTTIIYLTGSPAVLAARIADDPNRPALTEKADPVEEIRAVISRREPVYKAAADMTFDTDNQSPVDIAGHIMEKLLITFK